MHVDTIHFKLWLIKNIAWVSCSDDKLWCILTGPDHNARGISIIGSRDIRAWCHSMNDSIGIFMGKKMKYHSLSLLNWSSPKRVIAAFKMSVDLLAMLCLHLCRMKSMQVQENASRQTPGYYVKSRRREGWDWPPLYTCKLQQAF